MNRLYLSAILLFGVLELSYAVSSWSDGSNSVNSVEQICLLYNRLPPFRSGDNSGGSSSYVTCGDCLRGYEADSQGRCREAMCPGVEECTSARRQPCGPSTYGKCGDCQYPYMDIEGVCMLEQEVDDLVRKIEEMIEEKTTLTEKTNGVSMADEKSSGGAKQVSPSDDFYVDKKAEISVNGEVVVTTEKGDDDEGASNEPQQAQYYSNSHQTTSKVEDNSSADSNKRAPSGISAMKMAPAPQSSVFEYRSGGEAVVGVNELIFFVVVLGVSLLCITSLIIAGVCWYRLYKQRKSMEAADYKGYHPDGSVGKSSVSRSDSSDRKLAQSAQMFHFQHHKQQMMAQDKGGMIEKAGVDSDPDDEEPEENVDGNYTVFMCPGLSNVGEMEVENPGFHTVSNGGSRGTTPTSPQSDRSGDSSKVSQ